MSAKQLRRCIKRESLTYTEHAVVLNLAAPLLPAPSRTRCSRSDHRKRKCTATTALQDPTAFGRKGRQGIWVPGLAAAALAAAVQDGSDSPMASGRGPRQATAAPPPLGLTASHSSSGCTRCARKTGSINSISRPDHRGHPEAAAA